MNFKVLQDKIREAQITEKLVPYLFLVLCSRINLNKKNDKEQ